MKLQDKEYTLEELKDLIDSIEGDFMIHIRLEVKDGDDKGSV